MRSEDKKFSTKLHSMYRSSMHLLLIESIYSLLSSIGVEETQSEIWHKLYHVSPREGKRVICSHTQNDLHVSQIQSTNFWLGVILDISSYSMITSSDFPCESLSQFLLNWEILLSFRKEHNLLWTFTISPVYYVAAGYRKPQLHWLKKYGFVFLIKWNSGSKWLLALAQYFSVRVNVSVILLAFLSRFVSGF